MSQKARALRSTPQPKHAKRSVNGIGSDKHYPVKLVDSAFEFDFDSRERAIAVGLRGSRNRKYTIAEKIAARTIVQPNGCWEVQGVALHSGHVQICHPDKSRRGYYFVRCHVFAWEQANERKVPKGLVVMHSCDHPRCVNPSHLSVGTQRQNILDSIRKGRYNTFGHQKLNAEKVHEIRARSAAGELQKDIARAYGIARNTVSGIVNGATWKHLPFVARVGDGLVLAALSPIQPIEATAGATLQVIDAGREGNQELHHLPEQGRRPEVIRHV